MFCLSAGSNRLYFTLSQDKKIYQKRIRNPLLLWMVVKNKVMHFKHTIVYFFRFILGWHKKDINV